MANTWRVLSPATGHSTSGAKDIIDVFNLAGSTRIVKIYRAWHVNSVVAAITATTTYTVLQVRRTNSIAGGSGLTPVSHDSANGALSGSIDAGTNSTLGFPANSILRQYVMSNDNASPNVDLGIDAWQAMIQMQEIWNSGYGESNVQPIVCRAEEGFALYQTAAITMSVGSMVSDAEIEFTDEAL